MLTRNGIKTRFALAALAAAALIPAPALAREAAGEGIARELDNPKTQKAVGDMLGSLMGAMLNIKADPLARAMERMGDHEAARKIPRGATLGDLAGPEARQAPGEVRKRVPMMMGAMSEMAIMMQDLAPMLAQIGKDFERQMDGTAKPD